MAAESVTPDRLAALDQGDAHLRQLVEIVTAGINAQLDGVAGAAQLAGEHVKTLIDRMPAEGAASLAALAVARLAEARLTLNRTEGKNL